MISAQVEPTINADIAMTTITRRIARHYTGDLGCCEAALLPSALCRLLRDVGNLCFLNQSIQFEFVNFTSESKKLFKAAALGPFRDRESFLNQVLEITLRSHTELLGACYKLGSLRFAEPADLK